VSAPPDALVIETVVPELFGSGERVEVRGPGVGQATLTVAGEAVAVIGRGPGRLEFRAPDGLPVCAAPLPRVTVVARSGTLADSVDVRTTGTPVPLDLGRGEHIVLPSVAVGCRVRFENAGTYGAALYRTAGSGPVIGRRSEIRLQLLDGAAGSPLAAPITAAAGRPVPAVDAPPGPPPGLPAPAGDPSSDVQCTRNLVPGDRMELGSPYEEAVNSYVATSTSEHYAVLVAVDSLARYGEARRSKVTDLARRLEREVHPFLDRVFEEWPDMDGDGRLHVVLRHGTGASYGGAWGYRVDGCPGDFVFLGHHMLDPGVADDDGGVLGTIVHEAMHWYDLGPDLSRKQHLPEWTVEAVATLAKRLWVRETRGQTLWDNIAHSCPADAVACWRHFMQEHRYGLPGFSLVGGYGHGSYILQYLLAQAVEPGADPGPAFGRIRHRISSHDDGRIRPLFELVGGEGRTEAELQGEYLLSFYADDHVLEASDRLRQHGWNVPSYSDDYPLRSFTLSRQAPRATVALARPDGRVFEVRAEAGAVLAGNTGQGLTLALVRAP
jgi:hypothetical protein